jgi:hypothetical protein
MAELLRWPNQDLASAWIITLFAGKRAPIGKRSEKRKGKVAGTDRAE